MRALIGSHFSRRLTLNPSRHTSTSSTSSNKFRVYWLKRQVGTKFISTTSLFLYKQRCRWEKLRAETLLLRLRHTWNYFEQNPSQIEVCDGERGGRGWRFAHEFNRYVLVDSLKYRLFQFMCFFLSKSFETITPNSYVFINMHFDNFPHVIGQYLKNCQILMLFFS